MKRDPDEFGDWCDENWLSSITTSVPTGTPNFIALGASVLLIAAVIFGFMTH